MKNWKAATLICVTAQVLSCTPRSYHIEKGGKVTNPPATAPNTNSGESSPPAANPSAAKPPAENPPAGNPPAESPPAAKPPAENPTVTLPSENAELGQYDFKYEGKHAAEAGVCSTGIVRGNSLREYCLNLQDESLTKGCAFNERIEDFLNRCPKFVWLESSQCEVSLIRREASLSLLTSTAASDVLKSSSFCVGRGQLADISSITFPGLDFYGDVRLKVEATWRSKAESSNSDGIPSNSWQLSLISRTGENLVEPFKRSYVQNLDRWDKLLNDSALWRVTCRNVARCN